MTTSKRTATPDPLTLEATEVIRNDMSFAYNSLLRHRLPTALQGAYSELLQALVDNVQFGQVPDLPVHRTATRKTVKGRVYWYWQWRANGKTIQKYIGPDGQPATAFAIQVGLQAPSREVLCAALRPVFGPALTGPMAKILQALGAAGLGATPALIIGTYAFVAYQGMFAIRWPQYAMTDDLDLAATAQAEGDSVDLPLALAKTGLGFVPARHLDTADPAVMYVVPRTQLRVDVLTPMLGRPHHTPIALAALNAHGAPIRYLDYLLAEPVLVAFPVGTGVLAHVPAPARYALHKLLIAPKRVAGDKRVKDIAQATALLALLVGDDPAQVRQAWRALKRKPASWAAAVQEQMLAFPVDLRDELVELLQLAR